MSPSKKDKYNAFFVKNIESDLGKIEIRLLSGELLTSHSFFNLLDNSGSVIDTPKISTKNADILISSIEYRGTTEGFNISEIELNTKQIIPHKYEARIATVRHLQTEKERYFTSTGDKLAYHYPIIRKYSDTGYGSIIRATMTLHQICSSHCPYCSTIFRKKSDSITLAEAQKFIETLYYDQAEFNRQNFAEYNAEYLKQTNSDIRLKGLILSGGGQPNLWRHFTDFITWIRSLNIDLGLITNGFPKNVPEDIYNAFQWVRLSITPEDASPHYVDQRFDKQYIPTSLIKNERITFGLSYVYGPWTDDDIILRINDFMGQVGAKYCRFLTDCNLGRTAQLKAHEDLAERLYSLGLVDANGNPKKGIFHQLKYHGTQEEANQLWEDGQCYLQAYNVFWDTSGHSDNGVSYCYPCDSVTVLSSDDGENTSERFFNYKKWGTVTNDNVAELFTQKVRPFFDPRKLCSACLFMRNNRVFKTLSQDRNPNRPGPDTSLEHINFP